MCLHIICMRVSLCEYNFVLLLLSSENVLDFFGFDKVRSKCAYYALLSLLYSHTHTHTLSLTHTHLLSLAHSLSDTHTHILVHICTHQILLTIF
jgi:hypothetical protein